jgi:hypothetical protein
LKKIHVFLKRLWALSLVLLRGTGQWRSERRVPFLAFVLFLG